MGKVSIYLDSCVLLDSISFRQGHTKVNSRRKFDIGEINPNVAEVLLSDINILELTERLKDSMISKLAVSEGYSYFDLRKDRLENFNLSKIQMKEIDEIFKKELADLPSVSFIKTKALSVGDVKNLIRICNEYSVFFMDALHFLMAYKSGCKMFVTSDKALRKSLFKVIKDSALENIMQIFTPWEFKKTFLKNPSFV